MPEERLWQWLRPDQTALHCHRDEDEFRELIQAFEAQLNDEPRGAPPPSSPQDAPRPAGRETSGLRRDAVYWVHMMDDVRSFRASPI